MARRRRGRGRGCKPALKRCIAGARGRRGRGKCLGKFSKCRSRKGR